MFKKKLKIGKLNLNSNVLLAPMAGITDYPYRKLYREYGCRAAVTEMINVRSFIQLSRKTLMMLYTNKKDSPLGVQLVGNSREYILKAVKQINKMDFDFIDFNAGCPVKKIVNTGSGSALLKNPDKLKDIIKTIKDNTPMPVTVKIRTGWDRENISAGLIAKKIADAGADAIFVHGRTRADMYSGEVDYLSIKKSVEAVTIPVIASGNLFTPLNVKEMIKKTGSAGCLIARGSFGNPWIFKDTERYLSGKNLPAIRPAGEVGELMLRHLKYMLDFYGQESGSKIYRKHFIHYTRYFTNAKPLRQKVFKTPCPEEIKSVIREFQKTAICNRHPYLKSFS